MTNGLVLFSIVVL